MNDTLFDLREEIESIDGGLLRMWEKRMYAAMKVGVFKRDNGQEISDLEREKQLWYNWQQQLDEDHADLAAFLFQANTTTSKLRQSNICRTLDANIYLIGMPASGKTSVGRAAAERCGRGFCDMDEVLTAMYGRSIGQMFEQGGEGLFRTRETALLTALASAPSGSIVATGGGAVLNPLNLSLMRASGVMILLEREDVTDAELQEIKRPLCPDAAAWQQLWQQREPLYRAAAAATVREADFGRAVDSLVEMLG